MKTVFCFITTFAVLASSAAMTHAEQNQSAPLFASISNIRSILPENPEKWDLLKQDSGIKLYQKKGDAPGTYKSECIISLSPETIYKVLYNIPEHIQWVQYCSGSKVIKKINSNGMIHYYSFDMPWPFQNRDMVLNTFSEKNPGEKEIHIYGNAFPHPSVPVKENCQRITQSTHEWVLKEIYPGTTQVTYKSRTVLNDSMPDFFADHLLRTMPYSMLQNLKEIALRNMLSPSARYLADADEEN